MVGPLVAMISPESNVLQPRYLYTAIWSGMDPNIIWKLSGTEITGGHFWIDHFTFGDGFTQFGLALGGFVAMPALCIAAISYLKDKEFLWTFLGLVGGLHDHGFGHGHRERRTLNHAQRPRVTLSARRRSGSDRGGVFALPC